jgi:hypothetical protein
MRIVHGFVVIALGIVMVRFRKPIAKWQVREQNRAWGRFGLYLGHRSELASAGSLVAMGLVFIVVGGLIALGELGIADSS